MPLPGHRLLLLFIFALGIRVAAISISDFDGLYGQDAFAYLRYAETLKQALAAFEPPPPFHWPIGYPLLVVATTTVVRSGARAAQWVSIVTGALVAPLVYALVRALQPHAGRGALLAALLAATAPQLLISSVSVMSDATGLAWITLSAWGLARYHALIRAAGAGSSQVGYRGAVRMLSLAAFALAMSILTRWVYVVTAPVWGLSTLLAWREGRVAMSHRIASLTIAMVVVLVVVGLQFAGDLSHAQSPHVGSLQVAGWNPLNAFRSTLANSDGVLHYDWPVGVFYALPLVHPSFVFPLLALFVCLGAADLCRGPRSATMLVIGWAVLMYLYLAGRPWENPRFSLSLLPPLLILMGVGFERIVSSAQAKWRAAAIACAMLGILGSLAWNVRTLGRFVAVKNAQLDIAHWVERSTPMQTTIASFGLNDTLQHYTSRHVLNLYELDSNALGEYVASGSLEYLLIDPSNVEDQWRGKSPALNFEWLRTHTMLSEVERRPPWVLFRIAPSGS